MPKVKPVAGAQLALGTKTPRTESLEDLLRKRLDVGKTSQWLFLEEIVYEDRRADVIAVQTWNSRGCCLVGYELKTQRADFLKELDSPDKRAWVESQTAEHWFVCDAGVVKDQSEIPAGWGFLEARGNKLFRIIQAPHDASRKPSERLWYTLLRRSMLLLEEERRKHEEFAEFRGRSLSYLELRATVEKAQSWLVPIWERDYERLAHEERRKRRLNDFVVWEERWSEVFNKLAALENGRRGNHWKRNDPEFIGRVIDEYVAGREAPNLAEKANQLRQAADAIDRVLAESSASQKKGAHE